MTDEESQGLREMIEESLRKLADPNTDPAAQTAAKSFLSSAFSDVIWHVKRQPSKNPRMGKKYTAAVEQMNRFHDMARRLSVPTTADEAADFERQFDAVTEALREAKQHLSERPLKVLIRIHRGTLAQNGFERKPLMT